MLEIKPGSIILFAENGSHGLARVDLVRERHLTSFPWSLSHREWLRGRRKIERFKVVAVLPEGLELAGISEQLVILKNKRDMELAGVKRRYIKRVTAAARAAIGEASR